MYHLWCCGVEFVYVVPVAALFSETLTLNLSTASTFENWLFISVQDCNFTFGF